jgi:hypothetical protein
MNMLIDPFQDRSITPGNEAESPERLLELAEGLSNAIKNARNDTTADALLLSVTEENEIFVQCTLDHPWANTKRDFCGGMVNRLMA